ncbi:MAG TPA: DUF5996 family protein [Aestuariivirgaceae bacterium]|jgi:hypothetical protein|nr:DUF5996 family protein [Aestuariivirgaceae bacterium]
MTEITEPEVRWPELPLADWQETCTTLQLWTQVVGKIRLVLTPWLNHSWHVVLYVTTRGLTTSPIPCGERSFSIDFDFIDHRLVMAVDDGRVRQLDLKQRSVADFYSTVMAMLDDLALPVRINQMPNEIPGAVRFSEDEKHASYDAEYAHRFWRVLLATDRVMKQFRTGFIGKASPVHFFWGSFDLAVTRFSGGIAPLHPGGVPNLPDSVAREAYSHEVSSAGFWPGGGGVPHAAFYSYAYPEPPGFRTARVQPSEAQFSEALGEFLLPYDAVRLSPDPDATLLSFLESTYDAAATAGKWDRQALECSSGRAGVPRALAVGR